ncbi:MAG: FG-GAP-like repeat-containing protein [Flavobacteriales bacterium]
MKTTLLTFFLISSLCLLQAQLDMPYQLSSTFKTREVTDADINGDGLHDLIIMCDEQITWSENLGGGQFATLQKLQLPDMDFFLRLAIVDLDNDGDNDIVGSHFNNYPEYRISVWRNQGFLLFDEEEILHVSDQSTTKPLVFDFDEDGWDDIVVCTDGKLKTFRNNNGELEEYSFQTTSSTTLSEMQLTDLNQDGVMDIIGVDNSGQTLRHFLGTTSGNFQAGQTMANGTYIKFVHIQDMNGDDNLDVIYDNGNDTDEFKIGLNNGSEYFTQVIDFSPLSCNSMATMNYGDWNNDGVDDVIVFCDYPGKLMFHQWNSTELNYSFEWPTIGDFMYVTEVETQDGDTDPQFVITGSPIVNRAALFEVYPNQELNFQELDESLSAWSQVRVADLNGDGYQEVITAGSRNRRLAYYLNQESSFSQMIEIGFIPDDDNNFNIETGDADADGDIDIAAFSFEGGSLMLYMNDGTAQFTIQYVNVPFEISSWQAADIDNDQRMDYIFECPEDVFLKMMWGDDLSNPQFQDLEFGSDDFHSLLPFDYDHDQDLDFMLEGNDSGGNGLLQLRVNSGNSDPTTWVSFDYEITGEEKFPAATSFQHFDYTGDGFEDLIFDETFFNEPHFIPLYAGGFGISTPFPYSNLYGVETLHDVNDDGDYEFIAVYNNLRHVFNETAPGVWESMGVYSHQGALSGWGFRNFDLVGAPEVLSISQEDLFIHRFVMFPFGWSFTTAIYMDANDNGIMDENEQMMPSASIQLSGAYNAMYSGNGTYWLPAQSGAYTVTPVYNTSLWQLSSDNASYYMNVNVEADIPDDTLWFGLKPLGTVLSAEINTTAIGWSCIEDSFQSHTVVSNTGNSLLNGVVALQFDNGLMNVVATYPSTDSIVGDTIYWTVQNLWPLSSSDFEVEFTHPGIDNIGALAQFHSSVFIMQESNLLLADDYADANVVECAYDPNDKQVSPQGFSPSAYVLNETQLEYTIRFQNTGNATAQDVIIQDQLSTNLDFATLQVSGTSHPMVLQLADDGLVHFHFQNIMLPDSGADYLGSMGYVKYRIDMQPELQPGTTIQNTAHIFFDTNPAITTNTTLSTIYTCQWLHTPVLIHFDDSLLWAPAGAVNYTWYRYGSEITIANGHTFNPLLPGEYTVLVQFEDDCLVMSEIFYYLVESLDEIVHTSQLILFPNPMNDYVILQAEYIIDEIEIYNSFGQQVYSTTVGAIQFYFKDSGFSSGMYFIRVGLKGGSEVIRFVKQ